jgi:Na+/phosphate symporter
VIIVAIGTSVIGGGVVVVVTVVVAVVTAAVVTADVVTADVVTAAVVTAVVVVVLFGFWFHNLITYAAELSVGGKDIDLAREWKNANIFKTNSPVDSLYFHYNFLAN